MGDGMQVHNLGANQALVDASFRWQLCKCVRSVKPQKDKGSTRKLTVAHGDTTESP